MTRGFTLLELLITVSVLSILIATAAPSFSSVTQTVKMQRLASELNGFLIQAKSESVKRNQDLWVHFSMEKNEVQSTGDWTIWLKPTEDLSGETYCSCRANLFVTFLFLITTPETESLLRAFVEGPLEGLFLWLPIRLQPIDF